MLRKILEYFKKNRLFNKKKWSDGGEYSQITYSQQGEDVTLLRFLEDLEYGFYVDIGAFHPFKYSNTCIFYKKGWSGINVEPNPDVRPAFLEHRTRDINLNVAVGNGNEELSYYKFNDPAVNSFSVEHVEKWKQAKGFYVTEVINVKIRKLSDILAEYLPSGKRIDFMTIDVESFDLAVLQSNDWNLYRPYILLVEEEILHFDNYLESPIIKYLYEKNYEIKTICNGTLFFIDKRSDR